MRTPAEVRTGAGKDFRSRLRVGMERNAARLLSRKRRRAKAR